MRLIAGQPMVPRWVIRKSWQKAGFRLPERKLFIQLKPMIVEAMEKQDHSNRWGIRKPTYTDSENIVLADITMDFSHWEFRFWGVGIVGVTPTVCECRGCGHTCVTKPSRKAHLGTSGCTTKIIGAYKLLLRDSRCVICDQKTSNTSFGVPLCIQGGCYGDFLHQESQPRALAEALNISARTNAV